MTKIGKKDVAKWLYELKKKNIEQFKYKDLPQELQIKRMILKAKPSGLISKVGKEEKAAIWRITKEGYTIIKLYGKI